MGLPLTSAQIEVNRADGKTYLTQWYERARFEWRPENPNPHKVLLGLLGREVAAARRCRNEVQGYVHTIDVAAGILHKHNLQIVVTADTVITRQSDGKRLTLAGFQPGMTAPDGNGDYIFAFGQQTSADTFRAEAIVNNSQ